MKAVRSPGLWRHCAPRTHQRRQKRTSDHHRRVREVAAWRSARRTSTIRVNTDQSESQEWAPARPDRYFGLGKATRHDLDRIRWLRYHRFRPPMTQYYSHMNTVVSCEQFWEPLGRAISAKIGTLLPHRRSGRRARFRLSRGVESSRPPASTFALPKSRE